MVKLDLLIIDPQNDFCKAETKDWNPALYVDGAEEDCARLAAMIDRLSDKITGIHTTLDTHHLIHIAHPIMWVNSVGEHPGFYTEITDADVDKGIWRASYPLFQQRQVKYVHDLKANGRYTLTIWPPHCLIGTPGHNVIKSVADALARWEAKFRFVDYVTKGSNVWTEHYSAIQADVPDTTDAGTMLDLRDGGLIRTLQKADVIPLAGQALSHCLANTVRDIANNFGEENIKKFVLLEDATSPVGPYKKLADDFVKEMVGRGMKIDKTTTFFK
jgi:nicotinamidase/pyrazinamidase